MLCSVMSGLSENSCRYWVIELYFRYILNEITVKRSVPTQILFSTTCTEDAIAQILGMVQWRATKMLRWAGTLVL